ncbi:Wadjet anti-phage system protein JetD domain-containing protein [Sinomonas sp. P47F7]|uniref:Wadjet anti-phage system protein JetD domain-containing protein n=1 Tax=Sinomonas sp. P47F7 TaxID=3410987 RepID=UPI003BF57CC3
MKTPAQVVREIERRLDKSWHLALGGDTSHWPHSFPLGKPTRADLDGDFAAAQHWSFEWQDWARANHLDLAYQTRRAGATQQELPSHVKVPDIDMAARVVGSEWRPRLARGRRRLENIRTRFPSIQDPWEIVRATDRYPEVDFELLCTAAAWFQQNQGSGFSPRQVPIVGLHSKWLNGHRQHVLALAGVESLGLVEVRPNPVHFTYIDPGHRQGCGRLHDSVCPGSWMRPEYVPEIVIITENKDTSVLFPLVPGAISVQGHGAAGPSLISQVEWLSQAPRIFYWGDLDARGFEIVNDYRRYGVKIETILMDPATLTRFAQFKAETDDRGVALKRSPRKPLPFLNDDERITYGMLTDPSGPHPIRVEQERVPLGDALAALHNMLRLVRD